MHVLIIPVAMTKRASSRKDIIADMDFILQEIVNYYVFDEDRFMHNNL